MFEIYGVESPEPPSATRSEYVNAVLDDHIEKLKVASASDVNNGQLLYELGRHLYIRGGRQLEAEAVFERLLGLDSENYAERVAQIRDAVVIAQRNAEDGASPG